MHIALRNPHPQRTTSNVVPPPFLEVQGQEDPVSPFAKHGRKTQVFSRLLSEAWFGVYASPIDLLQQLPCNNQWYGNHVIDACRIGGAMVLLAGVAFWSLGTLVAPPAAKLSLLALCASRVLVGLGEGLAPSSATNVMSRLIPE